MPKEFLIEDKIYQYFQNVKIVKTPNIITVTLKINKLKLIQEVINDFYENFDIKNANDEIEKEINKDILLNLNKFIDKYKDLQKTNLSQLSKLLNDIDQLYYSVEQKCDSYESDFKADSQLIYLRTKWRYDNCLEIIKTDNKLKIQGTQVFLIIFMILLIL